MTTHDLPRRIRYFRQSKHWTMSQLADELGVSRSAVKSWESGISAPTMGRLAELCDVFGVSLVNFFRRNIEPKTETTAAQ